MKVSVILPVFNGEKYILKSVTSVLMQTFKDFELIIINDCSKDNTLNIIKSIKDERIKIVNNEINLGIVDSLNKGIDLAQGKYIARMDADDLCYIDRLEKQYEILEEDTSIDIVGTSYIEIDDNDRIINKVSLPENDSEIKTTLLVKNCILHPSVMIKSSVLKKNKYSKLFQHAEDYELWIRLMSKCKFYNIQEPLIKYRITGENITIEANKKIKERIEILSRIYKKALNSKEVFLSDQEYIIYTKVITVLVNYENSDHYSINIFKKILNHDLLSEEKSLLLKLFGFMWLRYSKWKDISAYSIYLKVKGIHYLLEQKLKYRSL